MIPLTKPANVIVPMILFFLLTPGLFYTIETNNKYGNAAVHALVFGGVYAFLLILFPSYYY